MRYDFLLHSSTMSESSSPPLHATVGALWACAETCLSQSPPNTLLAIRCLLAATDGSLAGVDLEVTIKTRLMLARVLIQRTLEIDMARDQLQRAINQLAGCQALSTLELSFQAQNLLLDIYEITRDTVAGKNCCTAQIEEAKLTSQDYWMWNFHLRKVAFCEMERDYSGCIAQVAEAIDYARQKGNVVVQGMFMNEQLKYYAIKNDLATVQTLETGLRQFYEQAGLQAHPVYFQFLVYFFVVALNTSHAWASKNVDSNRNNADQISLHGHLHSPAHWSEFYWLNDSQRTALGSLIIGMSSISCQQFLASSLDIIKKGLEGSPNDLFLKQMKLLGLGNVALQKMTMGEINEARKAHAEMVAFALENHLQGDPDILWVEASLAQYSAPESAPALWERYSKLCPNDPARNLLARLHELQRRLRTDPGSFDVASLRSQLVESSEKSAFKTLYVAVLIIVAINMIQRNESRSETLEILQKALPPAQHSKDAYLKGVLLLITGWYMNMVNFEQAETLTSTAKANLKATGHPSLIYLTDKLLQDIYLRTGQFDKATKNLTSLNQGGAKKRS